MDFFAMTPSKLPRNAFDSAVRKVEWANQHIRNVEKTLSFIDKASANFVTIEDDPDGQRVGVKVSIDWKQFLSRMPLLQMMTGDAVHNLRSALDRLAYAIVAAFEDPPHYLYFPIDVSATSLVGQKHFGIIKRVAPDIADLILHEIKPYGAGNRFVKLNHLDRADKHRLLLTHTGTASLHIFVASNDESILEATAHSLILIKDDPTSESLRMPRLGTVASLHNDQYRRAAFNVSFDKGLPFENEPIVPTLHQLSQLVAGVIQILETHCFGQE